MPRHAPRFDGSRKLQRLARYMVQRFPKLSTPLDIGIGAKTTRASSDLSDLAANGIGHEVHRIGDVNSFRLTESGYRIARARLAALAPKRESTRAHDQYDAAAELAFNDVGRASVRSSS